MTSQCQGHAAESARAEHMKEAERLMRQYTTAVLEQNYEAIALYHFTLLAHIQRGAVPEGWQVVPVRLPPETEMRPVIARMCRAAESGQIVLFDDFWSDLLAAAPAPDHCRDAAKMVAGDEVHLVPASFADMAVYQSIADGYARDTALAPAEVPMPEMQDLLDWVSACQSAYHIDSTPGHRFGGLGSNLEYNRAELVSTVQEMLRTYGAACRAAGEAAGYARGLRDAVRDAAADENERAEWEGAVFTLMGHAAGLYANGQNDMPNWIYELAEKIARQHADEALAARVREVGIQQRAELAAALRGEVKP